MQDNIEKAFDFLDKGEDLLVKGVHKGTSKKNNPNYERVKRGNRWVYVKKEESKNSKNVSSASEIKNESNKNDSQDSKTKVLIDGRWQTVLRTDKTSNQKDKDWSVVLSERVRKERQKNLSEFKQGISDMRYELSKEDRYMSGDELKEHLTEKINSIADSVFPKKLDDNILSQELGKIVNTFSTDISRNFPNGRKVANSMGFDDFVQELTQCVKNNIRKITGRAPDEF